MSTIEFLSEMRDVLDFYISPLVKLAGILGVLSSSPFTLPSIDKITKPSYSKGYTYKVWKRGEERKTFKYIFSWSQAIYWKLIFTFSSKISLSRLFDISLHCGMEKSGSESFLQTISFNSPYF